MSKALWIVLCSGEDCWQCEGKPWRFSSKKKALKELRRHKDWCDEAGLEFDSEDYRIISSNAFDEDIWVD